MELVEKLSALYGDISGWTFIRKSQNLVYSACLNGRDVVFRLSPAGHRLPHEIESEIRFMRYLSASSPLVCKPVADLCANAYVALDGTERFIAVCFERAKGRHVSLAKREDVLLFARTIVEIHTLSRREPERIPRKSAVDSPYFELRRSADMGAADQEIVSWFQALAKSETNFGLIHGDYNTGNILLQDGRAKVFDFDDCAYHWYDYEIANTIYMVLFSLRASTDLSVFTQFRSLWLNALMADGNPVGYEPRNINNFVYYRVLLLEGWIKEPELGPLFIVNASESWKAELLAFIDWFKERWGTLQIG